MECLNFLRELNIWSVMLRLVMAMAFGGLIGLERGRKRRAAGFRTYMLVCLGAVLTMLLSQYEYGMLTGVWAETAREVGIRTDVSRFGAQVINGIGFLGRPPGGEGPHHSGGPVGLRLHGTGHRRRIL